MDAYCRRYGHQSTTRESLEVWRREYKDSHTVETDVSKFCQSVDEWCETRAASSDGPGPWLVSRDDDVVCLTPSNPATVAGDSPATVPAAQRSAATCCASDAATGNVPAPVAAFVKELKLDAHTVLPEDVRGNADFLKALTAFAPLALEFTKLNNMYQENSKYHRTKSKLADSISDVKTVFSIVAKSLLEISDIDTGAGAVTHQSIMAMQSKLEKITDLLMFLTSSQSTINIALRHLMRRASGLRQDRLQPEHVHLLSGPNPSLTWDSACAAAEDLSLDSQFQGLLLSGQELLNCFATILKEHSLPVELLFRSARVTPSKVSTPARLKSCVQQLVKCAPVLLVSSGSRQVLVNIHSFSVASRGSNLAELLCLCDDDGGEEVEPTDHDLVTIGVDDSEELLVTDTDAVAVDPMDGE